ncbi:MAG: AAA family ATPase [Lachnospiraceae bacterium]|nr:AAA family ATPase [Lachnospiraceae bacterium]
MKISGTIESIIYRSEKNGYTVFLVNASKTVFTFVGNIVKLNVGETIDAEVEETYHPQYGRQYKILTYEIKLLDDDLEAVSKFILSLKIKGVGEVATRRIIDRFGNDTLDIIKNDPEKLYEIKGMNYEKIDKLSEKINERIDEIDTVVELEKYKLGPKAIEKIINKYGTKASKIISDNPYKLAIDIEGIGFAICDKIAYQNGMSPDSEKRLEAGIVYILENAFTAGNVYMPKDELLSEVTKALSLKKDMNIEDAIYNLESSLKIKTDKMDDIDIVFLRHAYATEKKLSNLLYEKKDNINIITGGPGTGKTYNIKKYLNEAMDKGLKVAIAAPTGRAAKRINEVTGYDAKTIHRLLECVSGGDDRKVYFNKNEDNKLDIDLLIVDEMSMVDESLMCALISAVPDMTAIILVGDVDQLPSVGAGQVLSDMIKSGLFKVVKLDKIYRQDEGSNIAINAHLINDGKGIDLKTRKKDFVFVHKNSDYNVKESIKQLVSKDVKEHFGIGSDGIQVICPSKVGSCGVATLNYILQEELNGEDYRKVELKVADTLFRVGDKVMQTTNNYDIPYDIVDSDNNVIDQGAGVFNGDIGEIIEIDDVESSMVVKYDDRLVYYLREDIKDLSLAYAITVHKSQGSEYDVVIMPMVKAPYKLMTRKILYTAMTRAKKCMIFVGNEESFNYMKDNKDEIERYSALCSKLYIR